MRYKKIGMRFLCCLVGLILVQAGMPVVAADGIKLQRVFEEFTFDRPVAFVALPGQSSVWYIVEQAGRVIRLQQVNNKLDRSVFIDISNRVDSGPNEAGLLGMTFDPGFNENGRFYLSYTRDGKPLESVLSRFVSGDRGESADSSKEHILITIKQPYSNHNGGNILFGPDGYLYYGLGDGGWAGDPDGNGQNTNTLLGSLLRIDVSGEKGYRIPEDNPFAKDGGKPEIYAYGLRNPWRWSFDRKTGELWLADVGQDEWEEVNRIERGGNYGWNLREGLHCYSGECEHPGLKDPVAEYSHDHGCSITGGYVYRGRALPFLEGTYLYADFCSGTIWGMKVDGQDKFIARELLDTRLNIASFGEDNGGELYVVDLKGRVFRIVQK